MRQQHTKLDKMMPMEQYLKDVLLTALATATLSNRELSDLIHTILGF